MSLCKKCKEDIAGTDEGYSVDGMCVDCALMEREEAIRERDKLRIENKRLKGDIERRRWDH